MTSSRLLLLAGSLLIGLPSALAQEAPDAGSSRAYAEGAGVWGVDEGITAASLARDGWQLAATTGLSWPDGRQALVTIWLSQLGDHARCFDYFTPALEAAGGRCERTGHGL